MNVLVDTNVWLDLILRRQPHYDASAAAIALLDDPGHSPYVAAHAVTTLAYLVERARDRRTAARAIEALLDRVGVAAVDGAVLRDALDSPLADFEDAVVTVAAVRAGLDAIVTRNARDFADAELPVYTPAELVAALRKPDAERSKVALPHIEPRLDGAMRVKVEKLQLDPSDAAAMFNRKRFGAPFRWTPEAVRAWLDRG